MGMDEANSAGMQRLAGKQVMEARIVGSFTPVDVILVVERVTAIPDKAVAESGHVAT